MKIPGFEVFPLYFDIGGSPNFSLREGDWRMDDSRPSRWNWMKLHPHRAFDIALKVKYDLSRKWTLAAGYRMLEGGANVDDVYAFAWLHYAVASLTFRF